MPTSRTSRAAKEVPAKCAPSGAAAVGASESGTNIREAPCLTERLFASVLCEARVVASRQPCNLVGDHNVKLDGVPLWTGTLLLVSGLEQLHSWPRVSAFSN